MSEKEARAILQDYREEDEDTGEEYSRRSRNAFTATGCSSYFGASWTARRPSMRS